MVDLKDIIGTMVGGVGTEGAQALQPQIMQRHRSKTYSFKRPDNNVHHQIFRSSTTPVVYLGTTLQNLRIKPEGDCVEKGEDCFKPLFYVSAHFWLNANQNF